MKRFFQQAYLNIISLIGLAIIAILSTGFFLQWQHFKSSNLWVTHTQITLENTFNIMSNIYFMEASMRAYMLTKEQSYLNDYQLSIQSLNKHISKLLLITKDNNIQQVRLQKLKKLLGVRIEIFNVAIAVRKNHDLVYTLNYLNKDELIVKSRSRLIDEIKQVVQEITSDEKNLLQTRIANLVNNFGMTIKANLVANIAGIIIVLVCLFLLNRQLIIRHLVEKKLQESQDELKKLAYFDNLTGLNNRNRLLEHIKESIEDAKVNSYIVALFYLDLDNFKSINDAFGHGVGDMFLQAVSNRLNNIPYEDKFISRISGDEFVILLSHITREKELSLIAQKIIQLFSQPIQIDHQQIAGTVSIGISTFPDDAHDENSLIKNADIAMYKAKQIGKNNFQFSTTEMSNEFAQKTLLYHQLYQAVMKKEFIIMYQPKMSLHTEKPSGFEALIRWSKPNEGIAYPAEFITFAENNGLIVPIGEWMLRSVCEQAKRWLNTGIEIINVSVNVSFREFLMGDFANMARKILDETGFPSNMLEIEIIETTLMEKTMGNISALQELKSLGVQITIDDFGTGYSSLSYLNLFPIDKIKIDKSFVSKITPQYQDHGIINAIIAMAHNLGIKVIAEGVENQAQYDFLKRGNCDEIQGYYYSQPLTLDEMQQFFIKHKSMKFIE